MSVKLRGFPRFRSFRQSCFFSRTDLPLHAVFRAAVKLRRLAVFALATVGLALAGSVLAQVPDQLLAQAPAVPADPKAADAPPAAAAPDKTVKSLEIPSPWDAPEPWRTDRFYFQFAYYTWHFHYDADHQQSYLFDAEYHFKETWLGGQWIAGMALFQNSFGQFSQYLFGGLLWRPIESEQPFYVKLTAGPLHGYSGQYQNKVPFNSSGVAPAIIPGVGYCVQRRYCGEFVLLGTNAALFTIGVTVP
jgi:hypothetical protein